ncbi:MAG TPA: SCO family protein, partial [Candidatus Hydrogenedentes bacterium]|nr:SCO family protein [Candidatus Hydrogenedentota bacterium]
ADTRMWHFLTGPAETIHLLAAKGFNLGRLDDPTEHSSRLVLVDRTGHIRGYYDGIDPSQMQRLIKDIRSLLAARG